MIDDDDDVNDDVVVMISRCERKGRRVTTTKETKSGTIVSDEAPLVWLAGCEKDDDDDADEYCHRCFEKITKPNASLKSSSSFVVECEYCNVEKYCSVDCRRLAASEYHRKSGECFAFETGKDAEKSDPTRYPFDDVPNRFAIRAYAKLGGWTGLEKTLEEKKKVSENLRKHLNECVAHVPNDYHHNDNKKNFLSTLCSNTRALMGADEEIVKEEDFVRAAWAMRANAHTLYDYDYDDDDNNNNNNNKKKRRRKKIGVGLFPEVSRSYNHSCEPNAVFENVRLRLRVRLIKDVASGEEITISYLNDDEKGEKRQHRRELLKKQYNFDCDCAKCEREK